MAFRLRSARIPATHRFINAVRFVKAAIASRLFRSSKDAYFLLRSRIGRKGAGCDKFCHSITHRQLGEDFTAITIRSTEARRHKMVDGQHIQTPRQSAVAAGRTDCAIPSAGCLPVVTSSAIQ